MIENKILVISRRRLDKACILYTVVSSIDRILLANSNQWYFNNLVKRPCHKTPYRCPHRLNLSSQSSRSCALPNIKALKDKDLEFANSIRALVGTESALTGGAAQAPFSVAVHFDVVRADLAAVGARGVVTPLTCSFHGTSSLPG